MTLKQQLSTLINNTDLKVSEQQIDLLIQYVELLNKWNKAYNLTSVRDPSEMLIKHIMDSLMVGEVLVALYWSRFELYGVLLDGSGLSSWSSHWLQWALS